MWMWWRKAWFIVVRGGAGGSTCRQQQRNAMTKQTKGLGQGLFTRGTQVRTFQCRTDNVTQVMKSRGGKKKKKWGNKRQEVKHRKYKRGKTIKIKQETKTTDHNTCFIRTSPVYSWAATLFASHLSSTASYNSSNILYRRMPQTLTSFLDKVCFVLFILFCELLLLFIYT